MAKASRRKRQKQQPAGPARAPYVARPFAGIPGEADWVAMREIVPAATADVQVRLPGGTGGEDGDSAGAGEHTRPVRLVTVLPGAMPALHREDGTVLVALQSRTSSGDASRDVAQALLAAATAEPGSPVTSVRPADAETPRMQDLLVDPEPLDVTVHEDFSFWLDEEQQASPELQATLEETNAAAVPTVKVPDVPSAYWCRMGDRAYIRWLLTDDEDDATRALARLQARGEHTLGGDSVLLGAFRAAGLLVPVLEVDPGAEPTSHGPALAELAGRYAEALQVDEPLSPDERRARDGIISRQVTLR